MTMGDTAADFTATDVLSVAAGLVAARRPFALGIVVEAQGSTSARTGAKAVFDTEGAVMAGWVGGGCAESTIAHAAIEALQTETPQMVDVDLDDEVLGAGMPCGGRMRVYVEPVIPRPTLWILGHGRVAECLCRLGAMMSFDVVVNDTMASSDRFPDASRIVVDDASYTALTPAARDFVIVATQHKGDHESLRRLLASDVGYIALIASSKRTGLVMEYLRNAGFDQGAIDRIHAPAGIEIGARTAEEIALSVISEVVLSRRVGAVRKGIEGASATKHTMPTSAPRQPTVLSQARTLRAAGN
jgi:xanthine dehydrogenase accessory factor